MSGYRFKTALSATLSASLIWVGCGGQAERTEAERAGAPGGGQAGATTGGAASTQGGQETSSGGVVISFGGAASGGESSGGQAPDVDGCVQDGRVYRVGETFSPGGGCAGGWCTCYDGNEIWCTLVDCPEICQTTEQTYWDALEEARRCDPASPRVQCTEFAFRDAACECTTSVNPANEEAMKLLAEQSELYALNECKANVTCAPCTEHAALGYCSSRGRCETASLGASCVVNGAAYPNGSGLIEPLGCNRCRCENGSYDYCTLASCDGSCPPDTVLRRRCVKCGEQGLCDSVEHGCFPECVDSCPGAGEACVEGVCSIPC